MVATPVDAMLRVAAWRPPSRSAGSWGWPAFWTPSISNLYRLGTQGSLEGTTVLRLVRLHGTAPAPCLDWQDSDHRSTVSRPYSGVDRADPKF